MIRTPSSKINVGPFGDLPILLFRELIPLEVSLEARLDEIALLQSVEMIYERLGVWLKAPEIGWNILREHCNTITLQDLRQTHGMDAKRHHCSSPWSFRCLTDRGDAVLRRIAKKISRGKRHYRNDHVGFREKACRKCRAFNL